MSLSSAPWLAGLDGTSTWNSKPASGITTRPTSVTHNANTLLGNSTRVQRRSLSGNSIPTVKQARSPLAPLHANENNSVRRKPISEKERNAVAHAANTIQQRSKSSSPVKKEATLEWRKRLLYGKTAYGEQVDLFGPSGLENIFDSAKKSEVRATPETRVPLARSPKTDATMPSSPPPWPLKSTLSSSRAGSTNTSPAQASHLQQLSRTIEGDEDGSGDSDQFDLHLTEPEVEMGIGADKSEQEQTMNRMLGGVTELEQEEFSPVFVSKQKNANGKVDYVAIDQDELNALHGQISAQSSSDHLAVSPQRQEESVYTDGSSRHETDPLPDLSLSENLPTGTPEPLGRFVQVQRGGYSVVGSFKHRPLSAEPSATGLGTSFAVDQTLPPAPTPPSTKVVTTLDATQLKRDTPSTPLKLFATHDTFTNKHLLHRMTEFDNEVAETAAQPKLPRQVSFGEGELDQVDFQHPGHADTPRFDSSPASDAAVPGSRRPQGFQTSSHTAPKDARQSLGKRLRDSQSTVAPSTVSPVKTSTPKRRRTLHVSELLEGGSRNASSMLQEQTAAEHEPSERARAPTPLQRHAGHGIDESIREATEEFLIHEDQSIVGNVLEAVEESLTDTNPTTLKQRAEVVAGEIAKYTLRVNHANDRSHGARKPSVTTQDFFREAECVMEYIRSRAAQKKSMLASVAEDDPNGRTDNSLLIAKGSDRSLHHMRVSREPSWEDRPRSGWREPEQQRLQRSALNTDRVASQLRRWKEPDASDEHDIFLADPESDIRQPDTHSSSEIVYDQQAQIRITGPSSEYNRRQDGSDSRPTSQRSGQSSTRRSDNVGTLAPSAVAHLIGSEVGGMTFDKDKQRWIRTRSPEHKKDNGFLNIHESHVTSEDDPFREISDLAVDESIEKRRISSPARLTLNVAPQNLGIPSTQFVTARPASFHSTQRQLSINDTVLRPDHMANVSAHSNSNEADQIADRSTDKEVIEDVSGILETPFPPKTDATHIVGADSITSAPEADFMQRREGTAQDESVRPTIQKAVTYDDVVIPILPRPAVKPAYLEHSELSFVAPLPGDRMISVSLSVSKPSALPSRQVELVADSSPLRNLSTLLLSDLPDFTVNGEDPVRPSETALAERFARYARAEAKDRFSLVTKELVRSLTDLYPEQLYWDEIEDLHMSQRALGTLHGLDQYCHRVRSLDVSNNALTQLDGAPSGVCKLKASSNELSSLTRFAQLRDLQYVDASRNALDSIAAFSGCIHLRELRIDDNQVQSISSLADSGLLRLHCRRNNISSIQFGAGDYATLTKLDLSGNNITSVSGMEHLTSLECLRLNDNVALSELSFAGCMPRLRRLYLRNCHLSRLDVTGLENLEILDVDNNMLYSIDGLESLHNLQRLSMRRQKLATGVQISVLDKPLEAHTVYLGGNVLPDISTCATNLSIRHLELAAAGLTGLPSDFGLRFANLRTLNLNHNSLKDLRPLLQLTALQTLYVTDNRISRLRKLAAVLSHLPKLAGIDMRDNPTTQGFYGRSKVVVQDSLDLVHSANGPDDTDDNGLDVERYLMPQASAEHDRQHVERLDDETNLRRRVYELLLAHSCKKLRMLDGLTFNEHHALKKDGVWDKLLALGVVRRSL